MEEELSAPTYESLGETEKTMVDNAIFYEEFLRKKGEPPMRAMSIGELPESLEIRVGLLREAYAEDIKRGFEENNNSRYYNWTDYSVLFSAMTLRILRCMGDEPVYASVREGLGLDKEWISEVSSLLDHCSQPKPRGIVAPYY